MLTEDRVAEQIDKLMGNVAAIGRAFGVTRQSVQGYIDRHPALKERLADARATMVDNVESRFYADCLKDEAGYQTSRIFFLKTQGKDRGYVERQEVTGKDGKDLMSLSDDDIDKQIAERQARIAGAVGGEGASAGPGGDADDPAVVPHDPPAEPGR